MATDETGSREVALSAREQALERREKTLRETLHGAQAELMRREQVLVEREKTVLEQEHGLQEMQKEIEKRQAAVQTLEQELEQHQRRLQSREESVEAREVVKSSSESPSSPAGPTLEQLTDVVAQLTEALNRARNSERGTSERCEILETQVRELNCELGRARDAAQSAAEARQSHQEHQASRAETKRPVHESSRSSLDDRASSQLEVDLLTARLPASSTVGGGVARAIAAALHDIELGNRSSVTIVDLGLSDVHGLNEADRILHVLTSLMAVRADARLIVFGLWAICHLIYVVYVIYAHLFQKRVCLH